MQISKVTTFLTQNPYSKANAAVGFFVDGLHLKYVWLSLTAGKVTLQDFKTVSLNARLEAKATLGQKGAVPDDVSDENASGDVQSLEMAVIKQADNASVLFDLIPSFPPAKFTISYALAESAITYQEFSSDFGLKDLVLKKRIVQELAMHRTKSPSLDSVGIIPTATSGLLSVVREDGLQLYDLLMSVLSSQSRRVPKIKVINSVDLALMELVRSSYKIAEEEISVLVYVGYDFSRVIFMQGYNYLHISPIINEGYGSANIENIIHSRLLLVKDNIEVSNMDRILLSGESHKTSILDALQAQFPDVKIDYIETQGIEKSLKVEADTKVISEYAIPIAVAWKALQPKLHGRYDVDLVPKFILERQKDIKLAWHAWIFIGLIFLSTVYFTASIISVAIEKYNARDLADRKETIVTESKLYQAQKDSLLAEIAKYETALKVYDSIAIKPDRWIRVFDILASTTQNLDSITIYSIQQIEGKPSALLLSGRAYSRSIASRFLKTFEEASLLHLRMVKVQNREYYDFDIRVEKFDAEDIPYIPIRAKKK